MAAIELTWLVPEWCCRQEEVKVKMVTSDDDLTTDITLEGDEEELDRFR